MRKIKALGVAPYEGIKELMKKVVSSRSDLDLDLYTANLDESIEIIREAKKSQINYEVIISRGGTAHLLEEYVDIPVIEINFTISDILQVMNEVDITSTNYAIVGYPNLTNIARNLCNMLNLDVEIYTTYSSENVETTLELLKLKGVELILADTINYERAKAYGINAKLVVSGEESIKLAFNEAVKIGKVYRELQLESSLYKSLNLMDDCDNYIFDSNYNLVYSSSNDESDLIKNLLMEKSNELTIGEVSNFFKNHDGKGFHIYIKSVFISKDVYYLIRVKAIALEGSYDKINIIDRKE
ncbi:MAG: hypothetical protein GX971_05830, partial [Firmicutes bacterium]|nr:hypothetical protein [Bacillota bacterium]